MRIASVSVAMVAAMICGCSSNPPVSSLSSMQRQRVAEMPIVTGSQLARGSYRVLGTVEGIACKRNAYASGSPSLDEARQGVRIRAVQLGADAVMNVVCEDKQEVDWAHNCWQTVLCVGDAISVQDAAALKRAVE